MPGIKCSNCSFPYRPAGQPCPNCGYSGCFITAAVCTHSRDGDDNRYLDDVRYFRDTYMQETGERRALVEEYYRIAPMIVDAIAAKANSAAEYGRIRAEYLDPAVECIRRNDGETAERIYVEMVETLAARYGVGRAPRG